MVRTRLVLILVAMFGFSIVAHAGSFDQKEVEEAIKTFFSTQKSEREEPQSVGSEIADLDGDGKPELVLLWVLLGPTYSSNSLTIFSKTAAGYKPASSLLLNGIAIKLSSVKAGIITVDQELFAKNDPRCCPSMKRQMKYRWLNKKISEVRTRPASK
jgi:hypothetical protein